jgi:thiamine biosynthesis protein ThiS
VTTIFLNGESCALDPGSTVADAVRLFPVASGVAIARNGELVPKSAWGTTALEPSDRLEVLSVAPGG